MISTTDFRNGLKIEIDGVPYAIVEFQHYKPGKGGAIMRTKLRNLLNGRVVENTFRSGEKVNKPDLETRTMQFLYREDERYVFMDLTNYEQVYVDEAQTGGKGGFLKDGEEVKVLVYNGRPLDMELPAAVTLKIVSADPGVRGDTVSGASKPARMETGITVNVPLFVNEGDTIKVDTRTGQYLGRA
jgi:elongation factor P